MMTASAANGSIDLRARARIAFLAAAYGDALGWPNETRGKAIPKKPKSDPSPNFIAWSRRDGFRATAHSENIEPGTYSDDTQLIIASSRSLLVSGDRDWWRRFTRVELPFWRLYQRGGGGATLRAAKAWSDGKPPWQASRTAYFDAGGNGVAMRILPHVIWHYGEEYQTVHRNVILDGIATHGHPRALMGAALFSYVLWRMLHRTESLAFGEMIQTALASIDEWSASPMEYGVYVNEWSPARWQPESDYKVVWDATRAEIIELLRIVSGAMEQGALFVDRPTLERLGALGPQRGSGTISAVSAIFLASRYASDPTHGVLEAAFALGADTDTLACMTATLLSTVREGDQLAYRAQKVQDRLFLENLGAAVADKGAIIARPLSKSEIITTAKTSKWLAATLNRDEGEEIDLLDGRGGTVRSHRKREERDLEIVEVVVVASDGQTLRFKRADKRSVLQAHTMFEDLPAKRPEFTVAPYAFAPEVVLRCRNLDATVRFYELAFNLRIHDDRRHRASQMTAQVRFEGNLTFVQAKNEAEVRSQAGAEIRLRTRQTVPLAEQIARAGMRATVGDRDGAFVISATDPDGRMVIVVTVR